MRLVKQTFKDSPLPLIALVANKCDLNHLTSVSLDKHNLFIDENGFIDYFVSAKSGENINKIFYQTAAYLCNVDLDDTEVESFTSIVPAAIIDHQKDDPHIDERKTEEKKSGCIIS